MTLIQERLRELEQYKPTGTRPEGFERFWLDRLKADNPAAAKLELEEIVYPLQQIQVFKAALPAGDGVILRGYYLRPAHPLAFRPVSNLAEQCLEYGSEHSSKSASSEGNPAGTITKYPGLVRFHGYSGNRGQISELLLWALQGYAILALDVRGQCGETPDGRSYPTGRFSGWLTLGLDSPENHYFRQVYLDALRAVEALSHQPEVDEKRLGVFGKSQGGGLAVAAAGLANGLGERAGLQARVKAVSAAIPFLADFRGGFRLHTDGPLVELSNYFRYFDPEHKHEEGIFEVLDYFDILHFAPWFGEQMQSLISIGLKDTACPPPSIHALYRAVSGEKRLLVYPEYGHESPDEFVDRQIKLFIESLN